MCREQLSINGRSGYLKATARKIYYGTWMKPRLPNYGFGQKDKECSGGKKSG